MSSNIQLTVINKLLEYNSLINRIVLLYQQVVSILITS
jgi:hypothetical protein